MIAVVNRILSEQTETIMAHGGTIIAYLGDGLMAAFGAPIEQPDHADRALAAARELIGATLPALNAWMREQGYGDGFRMGVGLNSGSLHLGQRRPRAPPGVHGDRRRHATPPRASRA